jgi:hypothetical protein
VALVALGYVALERLVRTKPAVQGATANSIAVLPLANESGDASQQYFSDGLSEDLITALSQFPGLKVIGRTSSFQFRDSKDDSKTIGANSGVSRLLEGSVRHAGISCGSAPSSSIHQRAARSVGISMTGPTRISSHCKTTSLVQSLGL